MIDKFNNSSYNELIKDVMQSTSSGHLTGLEDAFIRRFPDLYCLKYKPIKRKPMTFVSSKVAQKHRPWQIEILRDAHPNKIIQKSRQLGLSEVGMSEALWFLDVHDDTKAMYCFPRDAQMKDFSNTRVAPAIQDSPYFSSLVSKDANNVALKKFGNSYLFMRSAWGSALGEGADLDLLCFDEYDRMKDNVELAFQEGLKSSRYGWMRRWSTPTIPGRGVNLWYEKSDKKQYVWTCEHCGHKQVLTMEDNIIQVKADGFHQATQEIDPGTYVIGCSKCKKELNRWGFGEWVAERPHIKETRGYMVSQLDAVWISADDIMRRQFMYPSRQLFYNYVIGHPYAPEGLIITDNDIKESIRVPHLVLSRTQEYPKIVAGIDWGTMNWMLILGIKDNGQCDVLDIYWFADNPIKPLEPVAQFAAVLRAYRPNLIIADAGYGADRNSYLYTQFPNALFSCHWVTIKSAEQRIKFINQWNESAREVTVDKTTVMQRMLHTIKGRMVGMPPWCEKIETLSKHLSNVRIMDQEDDGQVYQVANRVGPDHLGCCLTYALIGKDKLTNMGAKSGFAFDFL